VIRFIDDDVRTRVQAANEGKFGGGGCSKLSYTKRLKCVRPYMVALQFKCTYNNYRKLTVWLSASS